MNLPDNLPPINETIARARREVIQDVLDGTVPCDVRAFAELHDHVDANYYGGAFTFQWSDAESCCNYWNAVQNAVHAWIASGDMLRESGQHPDA